MTSDDLVKRLRDHEVSRHNGGCQDCYGCLMDDAADEIERLRNQLSALPGDKRASEDGWQPIETAPRDGTVILAHWAASFESSAYATDVALWCGGAWRDPDDVEAHYGDPTHWRPLPAPPSLSGDLERARGAFSSGGSSHDSAPTSAKNEGDR